MSANVFSTMLANKAIITMNYDEIYEALKENDLDWVVAAEAIGCSSSHLMNVCSRRAESKHVATKISLLIGSTVSAVFADKPRYQEPDRKTKRSSKVSDAKALLEKAEMAIAS
ncbi:hypothetical protein [Methylophaga nitratireducenticrescens]|uniref:hypothetical protein n=1 Tax=Methylophaga nitratireducenticrescens TaxID=754476 RepID=UPI00146C8553|nr:hypothetical protein [Methylophaga nitratireducenticrescens]